MTTTRRMLWTLSWLLLAHAPALFAAGPPVLASWVELGPAGAALARAVTTDMACPALLLDGIAYPMGVRAEPSADYPVRVCEAVLAPGVTSAMLDGQLLPLPKVHPQRILALGDTGCRIKPSEDPVQDCHDPTAWPAERIAQRAAAEAPDLVIHLGDILYREGPCPQEEAATCGYTWDAFNADFFTPQAVLLRAAPWVFVRGNHEVCNRAGAGWFLFFDPRPLPESCSDVTPPYTLPAGDLQLQVFDSSLAEDTGPPDPEVVSPYATQLAELRAVTSDNAWFLTHRPVWGVKQARHGLEVLNVNLQAASGNDFPAGVSLLLSGHIHRFETLTFDAPRPRQVVVGTGGTALEPTPITQRVPGTLIAGATVTSFTAVDRFGYLLLQAVGPHWWAALREAQGQTLTAFFVKGRPRAGRR